MWLCTIFIILIKRNLNSFIKEIRNWLKRTTYIYLFIFIHLDSRAWWWFTTRVVVSCIRNYYVKDVIWRCICMPQAADLPIFSQQKKKKGKRKKNPNVKQYVDNLEIKKGNNKITRSVLGCYISASINFK